MLKAMKFFHRPFLTVFALCLLSTVTGRAQKPTADQVLDMIRYQQSANQLLSTGKLTKHLERKTINVPFGFRIQGPYIRFAFGNPYQVVGLNLGESSYQVVEGFKQGEEKTVPASRFAESIRNTDINYEDISMRFLYWPNAKLLGQDVVKERICWKVQVTNPSRHGAYRHVIIWADRDSGGLLQLHGFNDQGRLIKRFLVSSVQKVNGAWMLKTMRVESLDPNSGDVTGRTRLTINKPKRAK